MLCAKSLPAKPQVLKQLLESVTPCIAAYPVRFLHRFAPALGKSMQIKDMA